MKNLLKILKIVGRLRQAIFSMPIQAAIWLTFPKRRKILINESHLKRIPKALIITKSQERNQCQSEWSPKFGKQSKAELKAAQVICPSIKFSLRFVKTSFEAMFFFIFKSIFRIDGRDSNLHGLWSRATENFRFKQ